MPEGFLVVSRDDTGNPTEFWNGSVLQEELQSATFYTDKTNARLVLGALQSQYPEKEIALQPADQVLQLAPAAPNVPATSGRNVAVPAATTAQVKT
jgi:hypothetical protein